MAGQGQGYGSGQGQGQGPRPEEKTDTGVYRSRVRQKPHSGKAVLSDLVDGPNRQGRVLEQIQSELGGSASSQPDPLADRRLPRSYREHARQYFDRFRRGKG